MTRAELKAALERDRDEKAQDAPLRMHPAMDRRVLYKLGADSRHDDILDLVEALEKYSYEQHHGFASREVLGKLYAKYGLNNG